MDAEEGADDGAGKPRFVKLRHLRLMGFQTRTKASVEWKRISQDDKILLELGR